MRALAAFLAGLLVSSTALADVPTAHPLPPGVHAAWVVEGTARLRLEGHVPDSHLSLLPAGVFFTASGYEALSATTLRLQEDLANVRASLKAYEAEALMPAPAPASTGWSGRAVLLAFVGGAVLTGGVVLLAR